MASQRGGIRWLLIFWVFVISAVAYLDRVNISIAAQFIQQELRLSDIELGWVFSAFVLGYALTQAPGGRLADRHGPRKVLTFATVWWGIFSALTAAVTGGMAYALAIMIGVRFLLGVGEAVVYPASNRLVATWIPSRERGIANGIIFAGVGIGAGTAPPLITYILIHYGWRWSFWASAVIGLAAGAVWLAIARDKPAEHKWVSTREEAYIREGLPKATPTSEALPWRTILLNRNVAALTLSYFTFGYVAYIFFTWLFLYLSKVRGLDLKSSAYYGMLPFLAMATGSPAGGWIADRLTDRYGKRVGRCGVALVAMALSALFVALATLVQDARLASLVLAGGAGALYVSTSSFWSVSADIGGTSAGSVSGVMNMGAQLGGTVTASLTPFLAARLGWTASFLVAAGLAILGALAWILVDPARSLAAPPGATRGT